MIQRLSPSTQLSLMVHRSAQPAPSVSAPCTSADGRVVVVPSPDGTVRIVAKTADGRWVGEHCCLVEDADEKLVRAMEARARKHEREHPLQLVR